MGYGITGGNASGQVTTNAGQALTVNANPLFQYGTGNPSNAISGAASADTAATQAPAQTQQNLPPGFAGLVATPALGSGTPQLGSGTLLLIVGIGALALILGGDGGGRHR